MALELVCACHSLSYLAPIRSIAGGGFSAAGFESDVVGGVSFGDAASAHAGFNASNFESPSFSHTGGAVGGGSGGYGAADAFSGMVDTNNDGRLDAL